MIKYFHLGHGVAWYEELGEDGVEVPLEGAALQLLAQPVSAGHVAVVAQVVADPAVVIPGNNGYNSRTVGIS